MRVAAMTRMVHGLTFGSIARRPSILSSAVRLMTALAVGVLLTLAPMAQSWAKQEARDYHWTWRLSWGVTGDFESPEAAREAYNQMADDLYQACSARSCASCGKEVMGPFSKFTGGTKINEVVTPLGNDGGYTVNHMTACNGQPATSPTVGALTQSRAIYAQAHCPPGYAGTNTRPGEEVVVDGYSVWSYNQICVKDIPDPPPCAKTEVANTRCGNPVDVMSNAKLETATDYSSADGLLNVVRSYSSALRRWNWNHNAAVVDLTGRGTTQPASAALIANVDLVSPGSGAIVGRPVPFALVASDPGEGPPEVWYLGDGGRRTYFTETAANTFETRTPSMPQLQVVSAGGAHHWRVRTPEGRLRVFNAAGELTQEYLADGKSLSYVRQGGTLTVIAHPGGRQLVYSQSNAGVRAGVFDVVTLPGGGQLRYDIDPRDMVTKVTYPDTTHKSYLYDEAAHSPPPSGGMIWNHLTGLIDEESVRVGTYVYDSSGALSTEGAEGVNKFVIQRRGGEMSDVVTPPLNATTTLRWNQGPDGEPRITHRTLPGSSTTSTFSYDTAGNVARVTDFRGYHTCYANDVTRGVETTRLEGVTGACPPDVTAHVIPANTRQRKISTQWHPHWNFPSRRAEPGKITHWVYNGQLDPTAGTIASCATGAPNLPDGTPIAVVCKVVEQETNDATGSAGFAATLTGTSRASTYTYNPFGQVLTADGPRSDVSDTTTYSYHDCDTGSQCGRLASVTNALGHVTTYHTYDAHGSPLTVTDSNSVLMTYVYDLRQRLVSRTVESETTSFSYYPTGLLERVTLPDSSFLEYAYDAAHRLTGIADGEGNRIDYTLDDAGNRTAEATYDPFNTLTSTRTRVFDELSRMAQEIGAAGTAAVTTSFGYDGNGNPAQVHAPLGRDTSHGYDELNRLTQIIDPLSGITRYGYNALDQLISVTDPKGLVTSYTYNGLGDLEQQTSPDTGVTVKTFDAGGNLATSTDARGAITTYTYDALNRMSSAAFKVGAATDQILTYSYDAGTYGGGKLTSASDGNHSLSWSYDEQSRVMTAQQMVGAVSKMTSYAYANGQRQSMTTPSGQLITYGYAHGKVTSVSVNGTALVSNVLYEPFGPVRQWTWGNGTLSVRTFDEDGKITQIDSAGLKTYSYDDAFRITGIADTTNAALSWTYGYDELDRLTSASTTGATLGYMYDANGNRLTQSGANPSTLTIGANSNRVSSTSGSLVRTYAYDDAGNTTSYTGVSFVYNNRGRMSSSTKSGVTTHYTYNALGQLIKKGANTLYYYDEAGHIIGIYNGSGALTEEIVWLGDTPIASLRPKTGGGIDIYNIHTDHLNTPRVITDSVSSAERWRWDGDPFGGGSANNNPSGAGVFNFDLRFPGQIAMAETGLHYNYFRDYDPSTGRYVESDPIGLQGGINTYAYVHSNPLSYIDPLGLAEQCGCTKSYFDCLADCIRKHDPLNNLGKAGLSGAGGTFPKRWVGLPRGLGGASSLTTTPSAVAHGLGGGGAGTAGGLARGAGRLFSPVWIGYGLYLFGMEVYCATSCAADHCAH